MDLSAVKSALTEAVAECGGIVIPARVQKAQSTIEITTEDLSIWSQLLAHAKPPILWVGESGGDFPDLEWLWGYAEEYAGQDGDVDDDDGDGEEYDEPISESGSEKRVKVELLNELQREQFESLKDKFISTMRQSMAATLSVAVQVEGIICTREYTADWAYEVDGIANAVDDLLSSVQESHQDNEEEMAAERARQKQLVDALVEDDQFRCAKFARDRMLRAAMMANPQRGYGPVDLVEEHELQGIVSAAGLRLDAILKTEKESAREKKQRKKP